MIVGLSGKKGCGKNQVGDFLKEACGKAYKRDVDFAANAVHHDYVAKCLALADPIKQIACDYFGVDRKVAWGSQQDKEGTLTQWKWSEIPSHGGSDWTDLPDQMSVREILQWIGTEIFRERMHLDFWVKATMNLIRGEYRNFHHHIITDVRFPNEVSGIQNEGGIVVRVWRPGLDNSDAHASETSLDVNDSKWMSDNERHNGLDPTWFVPHSSSGFDVVILNTGTLEQLKEIAEDIAQTFMEKVKV